jgi:hypothetical protein
MWLLQYQLLKWGLWPHLTSNYNCANFVFIYTSRDFSYCQVGMGIDFC